MREIKSRSGWLAHLSNRPPFRPKTSEKILADKKKAPWINFVTEEGVLVYPWLNKPDLGRQYSSGKYSTQIAFEGDALAKMEERLAKVFAFVGKNGQEESGKKKPPVLEPILKDEINKDTEEPTGRKLLKLEMDPTRRGKGGAIVDQRPRILREIEGGVEVYSPQVFGGTIAKVEFRFNPLPVTAQGKNFVQKRLSDVLIIELAEGSGGAGGFDETQSSFGKVVKDSREPEASDESEEDQTNDASEATDDSSTDF